MPSLKIVQLGWDYSLDSPGVWVELTNTTPATISVFRVRATFVNPASNQVLGQDTEYLAGGGVGPGSGALAPGQTSLPVEVGDLSLSSTNNVVPYPVTATLQWSSQEFGGWQSWTTVQIPGGPPPGPFTDSTISSLPEPAQNVLNFVPADSTNGDTIVETIMCATGNPCANSYTSFIGTITLSPLPGGDVEVVWSVPVIPTPEHSVAPATATALPEWPFGNPAVFQFEISFDGTTLTGLNVNAQDLVDIMNGVLP
jgi:hypothetical protein